MHPRFVLNFTFKFDWLTYTTDNFQPAKTQTIWRLSGDGSDDIHKPMLGLVGLIITRENLHAAETFLPWSRSAPLIFFILETHPSTLYPSLLSPVLLKQNIKNVWWLTHWLNCLPSRPKICHRPLPIAFALFLICDVTMRSLNTRQFVLVQN